MIKIVICDDDEIELKKTKELCLDYAAGNKEIDFEIDSISSSSVLLKQIEEEQSSYDILLLDIYMPEMTGVDLARCLRERKDNCQIVFLTTSKAHAVEAFSLHAVHYLVKPYTSAQLQEALDKAIEAVDKKRKATILLKTTVGVQKVNLADIFYSETEKHIQNIHLLGNKSVQLRISCSELYEMLSGDHRFYKCGSTYIMNLGKITEVTTKHILFDDGSELPMQRRQYKELLNLYTRYLIEGR
ncbi:MAG: putative two-component response regulator [Herbinix sp.]|jgi:DNA-binding LytR/AlgR family response regulator|nr:putative two-component response regulator [Herbinix sp.]